MMLRLILILLFMLPSTVQARQVTSAKQAYIIDYETGQVLMEKESQQQMPTSSMSKVMTMYMVFDALKQNAVTLETKYPVSEKAWRMGGSKMFVELGKEIKILDLIRGVIVQSGNDATIVFAEGLAGSEEQFARLMTSKAKEIGMDNSNFMNASGWPDPDHYSTAEDLAVLAKRMIEDFPEYYRFYSETEFTYNAIKQANRNPLLYRNIGADGLKTGHTEIAGYGLIGTAQKEGRRVVMVINGMADEKERAEEGVRLVTWALNSFENKKIIQSGVEIVRVPITMSKAKHLALSANKDVKITVPKILRDQIKFEANYKSPLVAPIKAGQEVGSLKIIIPDQENIQIPLYAMGDVSEIGFFGKTLFKAKRAILGAE